MNSETKYNDFRDLEAWKNCMEIRKKVWLLCKGFPGGERYRLSDQMIRAARSSAANVAEGYGRFHFQENIQFCRQARGSLYELIDHLLVAEECNYLENASANKLIDEIKKAIIVLNGYVRYLKSRKDKG